MAWSYCAFGPVIQLGIPERHLERAVPHEFFDHLQRGAGIEELGGKGMPQRVGRIALVILARCR